MTRKKQLAVGQIWNAWHTEFENVRGSPWNFAIVGRINGVRLIDTGREGRFKRVPASLWVGMKIYLPPSWHYIHVFDDYGREVVRDEDDGGQFYLTRKMRDRAGSPLWRAGKIGSFSI